MKSLSEYWTFAQVCIFTLPLQHHTMLCCAMLCNLTPLIFIIYYFRHRSFYHSFLSTHSTFCLSCSLIPSHNSLVTSRSIHAFPFSLSPHATLLLPLCPPYYSLQFMLTRSSFLLFSDENVPGTPSGFGADIRPIYYLLFYDQSAGSVLAFHSPSHSQSTAVYSIL